MVSVDPDDVSQGNNSMTLSLVTSREGPTLTWAFASSFRGAYGQVSVPCRPLLPFSAVNKIRLLRSTRALLASSRSFTPKLMFVSHVCSCNLLVNIPALSFRLPHHED
jgi:hypothetical protein